MKQGSGWGGAALMALGWGTVILLVLGLGLWGTQARLSGAVVASGRVVVELDGQVVEHDTGGRVAEILVDEGDRVEANDILMRLDGSALRSERAIQASLSDELAARMARLEAERDGAGEMVTPDGLVDRMADPAVHDLVAGQHRLFAARAETLQAEVDGLEEQKRQIAEEVAGQSSQIEAVDRQLELAASELADVENLRAKGLTSTARLLTLQREIARLEGLKGELIAAKARNRGRMVELDISALRLHSARREQAITELRQVAAAAAETGERLAALDEKIARLDLRAPVSGYVHSLSVRAVNAVLRPAEPVLTIVADSDPLVVTARVRPTDVDNVYPGQPATLRFVAFDARSTPDVAGTVERLSPDALADEATGETYYSVRIRPEADSLAALGDAQPLRPGMPVEAFLTTVEQAPLTYLVKPFTDYFRHAFRES
ncbi:HlyD family type I secretion periplasmic adaptor subunit [Oceanomicrobium pacificus]|uniref:Membrane fusion protein (MFP) family protein n=1 Tax=Oceanomicrobium pacificus TaxID=2692916 RepID=A0A6B0TZK3_9RHOB|nr:HlyD family type I secretion periplasmic adaptor subunit [Oceanomicrobium pacificus]MXU66692.1 HlyD family type I secretion periplasmic adaptor subunit [Oceanomicrobium pacificus]